MLASDLINGALRLLGVIASGETPATNESTDALFALNGILESWQNQELLSWEQQRVNISLTAGQRVYVVPGDAAFTGVPRPKSVHAAGYTIITVAGGANVEYPLKVLTDAEYRLIPAKGLTSTYPQALYYESSVPAGLIQLWPVPTASNLTLSLYIDPGFPQYALTDTVALPPGYPRALRYMLAVELAPEYGKTPPAAVVQIALDAMQWMKNVNVRPEKMRAKNFPAKRGFWDYMLGEER